MRLLHRGGEAVRRYADDDPIGDVECLLEKEPVSLMHDVESARDGYRLEPLFRHHRVLWNSLNRNVIEIKVVG